VSEVVASLRLDLASDGYSVLVRTDHRRPEFDRLSVRWLSAARRSEVEIEVALDDLLLNVGALVDWPEPASVVWDERLRSMVEDAFRDSKVAEDRLAGISQTGEGTTLDVSEALGSRWQGSLTSFQARDVARILSMRHGANFSVPGAGKTRASLAVYEALRVAGDVDRLLVVCPKSAYESWQTEAVEVFGASVPTIRVYGGSAADLAAEILLVNYERLPDAQRALAAWLASSKSMLILDEAHRMKLGAAGAYGSACLSLGPRARRRLILSGTPAPNGPDDLRSLFSFVWPGRGRQVVDSAVNGTTLQQASQILSPFFVRTTKDELGLPPLQATVRYVDLPELHREIYDALLGQMSARARHARDDLSALGRIVMYLLMAADSPSLLTAGASRYEPLEYRIPPLEVPDSASLAELLRDVPSYEFSPKFAETLAIVADNAARGRKTLVWSTFVRTLTTLERMFADFHPAVVHGGTEDRDAQVARFRNDPNCMVLLSNPATLGEGISLHHVCHDAVYVDRDFAAGRFLQSLDRIHRLGLAPDTMTNVTVLIAAGTIDEVVNQRLDVKLRFLSAVLDDPAVAQLGDLDEEPSVGAGLSNADLRTLMGYLGVSSTS